MNKVHTSECPLPQEIAEVFHAARASYLKADFNAALALDRKAVELSDAAETALGAILGHRFVGLCYYRLHRLVEARASFTEALGLADKVGNQEQSLLISNHLSAALRSMGHLGEAYHLLCESLKKAKLPDLAMPRSRLHGNMGALLDEFGQRHRADDHYSRFEELTELLGNDQRLANARGLAARSAELRGDLETAADKYREERQLAERSGDIARQIAALMHEARISGTQALDGTSGEEAAEKLFLEALAMAEPVEFRRRRADVLSNLASFLLPRREMSEAWKRLREAELICLELRVDEKTANLYPDFAQLCHQAGLHGEALWYLQNSLESRLRLMEPLQKDPKVRSLAQGRFKELEKVVADLVGKAKLLSPDERDHLAVKELFKRIRESQGILSDEDEFGRLVAKEQQARVFDPEKMRTHAGVLWKERLLPVGFARLSDASQRDLVRSEVAYAMNDLGQCAQLIARVVERELRERVTKPLWQALRGHQASKWDERSIKELRNRKGEIGLGEMASLLDLLATDKPAPDGTLLLRLRSFVAPYKRLLGAVSRFAEPIQGLDGSEVRLVTVRNDEAHGKSNKGLTRLTVDAIKRRLVFEEPRILQALVDLQLP